MRFALHSALAPQDGRAAAVDLTEAARNAVAAPPAVAGDRNLLRYYSCTSSLSSTVNCTTTTTCSCTCVYIPAASPPASAPPAPTVSPTPAPAPACTCSGSGRSSRMCRTSRTSGTDDSSHNHCSLHLHIAKLSKQKTGNF